jgi:predicted nuclease with TOPRIM domain
MKLKYFTVLQENEKQKLSMQENIKKNIDLETKARALNNEKSEHTDQMYKIRMENSKMADEIKERDQQVERLEEQHDELVKKAAKLII